MLRHNLNIDNAQRIRAMKQLIKETRRSYSINGPEQPYASMEGAKPGRKEDEERLSKEKGEITNMKCANERVDDDIRRIE